MGSLYESFQTPAPSRKDMQRIGMAKTSTEQRKAFAETLQQSPKGRLAMAFEPVEDQGFGKRPDGTAKGLGFFGELPIKGGGVATEYSVGVQLESRGGKETDIPSLVPTLTKKERDLLLNDIIPNKKPIPDTIVQKAVDHANKRVKEGKNVFAQEGEAVADTPAENIRANFGAIGAGGSGFRPNLEQKRDIARAVPEIPKAIAAGTERALGTIGTALQFKGEQMQDPTHRLLMKAAPGPAIIQFIADRFGLPEKLKKSGKFISEYWNEQASKGWEAPDPELMEQKWNRPIQYGARVTFESAPTFAAAIGAGYATGNPAIGLTLLGAFEKLNSFAKQREKGASFQKANIISSLSGAWEAITEKIPFDFILKGKTKSKLIKAVTSGGLESIQELLAGMGQNFLEHFGYNVKDWKTVPGAIKEGLKHTFDNWLESVVAGGVLGAGAGVIIPGTQPPTRAVTPVEPTITPAKAVEVEGEAEAIIDLFNKDTKPQGNLERGLVYYRNKLEKLSDEELAQVLNWTRQPERTGYIGRFVKDEVAAIMRGRGLEPGRTIAEAIETEQIEKLPLFKKPAKAIPKKGTVAEKQARLAEAAKGPITQEERQKLQDTGMTVKEIGETSAEELRARLILSGETLEAPTKKPGDEPSGGVAWHTAISQALEKMPIIQRAIRRQQKISLKKRVGAAIGTLKGLRKKGLSAQEAIARSTGKLKGLQANYTQLYPRLDAVVEPWIVESAYNDIADTDRIQYFDRVGLTNRNGTGAFDKLVAGTALTPGEVTLIKRWIPEIGVLAEQRVPFSTKAWNTIIQVMNIPRSTLAGFADLSGIGRQQRALGMANIRKYVHAIHATHRAFFSGKFTDNLQKEYENSDFYDEAKEIAGVDFSAHAREATELSEQEEEFVAAPMLEQIPGLGRVFKATERAFVVPLNWLRMQVYETARIGNANMTESQMKVLGNAINDLSGRSSVGRANAAKKISVLMTAFFSPRFALSRIKLPYTMGRATFESIRSKELKKDVKALVTGETRGAFQVVGRSMALMIAGNLALMVLLKMLWPEDTEIDPDLRSSDGGKIKIGNKRIDLWSGYLQPAQLFMRLATGQRKSQAGRLYDVDVRDTLESFARSKTSPIVGLAIDLWRGITFFGEKLGAAPRGKVGRVLTEVGVPKSVQGISKELYNRMAPLTAQDFSDALVDSGIPAAIGMGALGFYGTGVQTYENWPAAKLQVARNQAAIEKHGKPWDDLKHIEQKRLKKEPALKEIEDQTIEERRKMGPGDYAKYIEKPLNDSAKRMMRQLPDDLQTELELLDMTPGGVKRTISSDFVLNDKRYATYENYTVENINRLLTPRIEANSWKTREYLSRLNVAQEKIIDAKAKARKRVLREINQGKL